MEQRVWCVRIRHFFIWWKNKTHPFDLKIFWSQRLLDFLIGPCWLCHRRTEIVQHPLERELLHDFTTIWIFVSFHCTDRETKQTALSPPHFLVVGGRLVIRRACKSRREVMLATAELQQQAAVKWKRHTKSRYCGTQRCAIVEGRRATTTKNNCFATE